MGAVPNEWEQRMKCRFITANLVVLFGAVLLCAILRGRNRLPAQAMGIRISPVFGESLNDSLMSSSAQTVRRGSL